MYNTQYIIKYVNCIKIYRIYIKSGTTQFFQEHMKHKK